jgi:hypothetical protein
LAQQVQRTPSYPGLAGQSRNSPAGPFEKGESHESHRLPSAGLARLKLWGALSFLFNGRRAVWYSITSRRSARPEEFKADMAALLGLLRDGAIHPVVVDRLPLAAARAVHARIDAGGFGGKIVLLRWAAG